jgi:hypothetical protein
MLDFTEQAVSTESLPELSADTPIVSDSLLDTNKLMASIPRFEDIVDSLADPETTAKTNAILAPYYSSDKLVTENYYQDETEPEAV